MKDCCEIVGERVVVVAAAGIIGSAVSAAVVGDGAVAMLGEMQHLVLPHAAVHQQAVQEYDGPARAPVSVEQVDSVVRL